MLRAHEPLILNWFRAKGEISNGAVEGLNNKIWLYSRIYGQDWGASRQSAGVNASDPTEEKQTKTPLRRKRRSILRPPAGRGRA
jgi:hypothetical protein